MISKGDLITELLQLVDSNPLTEIEINPIIEKHSIGLNFNEQRVLRANLSSSIIELIKNGDITSRNISISASSGEIWLNSSGVISSTLNRKEKLEQIEREKLLNKPQKSKWLTLSFYWEEFVKYWFKLLIGAIVTTILFLTKQCNGKDIVSQKKENTQPNEQIDTPKPKGTVHL